MFGLKESLILIRVTQPDPDLRTPSDSIWASRSMMTEQEYREAIKEAWDYCDRASANAQRFSVLSDQWEEMALTLEAELEGILNDQVD